MTAVVDALCNRGHALACLNRMPEALDSYRQALRIDPDHCDTLHRLGQALTQLGLHADALRVLGHALHLKLDRADTCFAQEGHERPLWLNEAGQDLAGKTILLQRAGGLGDTVQFCRYASLVAQLGARVILQVQPGLRNLLAGLEGVDTLLAEGEPLPEFDYRCPLASLPLAFGTDLGTIPARPRYLKADPERVQRWRTRLGAQTAPRVGLVWRGDPANLNDHNRSILLLQWSTLLECDAQFVSLQKEPDARERGVLAQRRNVIDLGDEQPDFADTAAVIESLDLVICVDTSVAHVAAAMGKPVWIILSTEADWRWRLEREDSPWYASVRLFRQGEAGDWEGVMDRLADALRQVIGASARQGALCAAGG